MCISGAGVCHSNLHAIDGEVGTRQKPIASAHENASFVEVVGSEVKDVAIGEGVAVFGAWGRGNCRFCG